MTEKNPYPMPFLMSADEAAAKIAALIARGKALRVIPWQMAVVARVLRVMPNWLYDRLLRQRAAQAAARPAIGLLDRHRLREVARLVDVGAAQHGDVVGEELQRDRRAGSGRAARRGPSSRMTCTPSLSATCASRSANT